MYLLALIAWLPAGILLYAFVCGNGSMFVKRSHPFGVRCEALEISFPSLYGSDANSRFRIARNVVCSASTILAGARQLTWPVDA